MDCDCNFSVMLVVHLLSILWSRCTTEINLNTKKYGNKKMFVRMPLSIQTL